MDYSSDLTQHLTEREAALVDLLWDYLKKDPKHKDRRQTAFGTKTKFGLVRSIEAIQKGNNV